VAVLPALTISGAVTAACPSSKFPLAVAILMLCGSFPRFFSAKVTGEPAGVVICFWLNMLSLMSMVTAPLATAGDGEAAGSVDGVAAGVGEDAGVADIDMSCALRLAPPTPLRERKTCGSPLPETLIVPTAPLETRLMAWSTSL
jgi:hypothetical protein